MKTYTDAIKLCREEQVPVLIHVEEVTQPQGHSTSGSHERYKGKDRLEWEQEFDCIRKMREFIVSTGLATEEDCNAIEEAAKKTEAREQQKAAWAAFTSSIKVEIDELQGLLAKLTATDAVKALSERLGKAIDPQRKELMETAREALLLVAGNTTAEATALRQWVKKQAAVNHERYRSHLLSETAASALNMKGQAPEYAADAPMVDGRELLRDNFDRYPYRTPRSARLWRRHWQHRWRESGHLKACN